MIGQTQLVVVPQVENDCEYEIWIDGKHQDNYQFIKQSVEYGYRKIKIHVKKGDIKINSKLCWAMYTTKDNNMLPLKPSDYCDWFYGIDCKVDTWYSGPVILNFYHLFPQGPTYFNGINPVFDYKTTLKADPTKKNHNTELLKKLALKGDWRGT